MLFINERLSDASTMLTAAQVVQLLACLATGAAFLVGSMRARKA